MTRNEIRLQELIKGRGKDSIEAELEFYWFKGGKTKSVRNRIIRLQKAMDHFDGHLMMRPNRSGKYECGCLRVDE